MIETVKAAAAVAGATIDALKSQPLSLALVTVNILFLLTGLYAMHVIADVARSNRTANDALILQLAAACVRPG